MLAVLVWIAAAWAGPNHCAARADTLATRLDAMVDAGPYTSLPAGLEPARRAGEPQRYGFVLFVDAAGALGLADRPSDPDAIARAYADYRSAYGEVARSPLIIVDRRAPWRAVAAALATVEAAGLSAVAFGFEAPIELSPPARSSIDRALAAVAAKPPSERATITATLLRKMASECAAIEDVMKELGRRAPDAQARAWAERMPAAVAACRCAADPDDVEALSWVLVGPGGGAPLAGVGTSLGDGRVVTLAADTPWEEAWDEVFADDTPWRAAVAD